ncbi:MAG: xanthine dehydrogenase family protein molybdopterin-binding subunit [Christensenellales bacterium]
MENKTFKTVGHPVRKKDAMSFLLGMPVYTDDITPSDCLTVKVLRSPYAHALIEEIDISTAMKVPGIECILTYKDVPQNRFTMAGQTYPEPSPYDRLILDKRLRFVGDAVAIIAGNCEKSVNKAMRLIKVKYDVLEPVLDMHTAKDNPILVHPEDDWQSLFEVGADNKRNLCSTGSRNWGDVDAVFAECDEIVEHTYHTKACQQSMMETFRTYTEIDSTGRLHVISSTQIVFHVRHILANALGIPLSKIHVEKPCVGGGFGAKQTVVAEVYPAIVTWLTKKPAKIIYTREECMTAGSPRHEMEIHVRLGATKDGSIKAIDMYTLSNAGAYGEHAPTTVDLTATKTISLYTGTLKAYRFGWDVVYTNVQGGGAFRGYGATQGSFAVESAVNEMADRLGIDPVAIREKCMVREGQLMPSYYDETASACALDRCLAKAKEIFKWDKKFPVRDMGHGKVRTAGVAMSMQGSGISAVDVGSAEIKLNEDGFYTLYIGAADMGTGCDTILAQIAAETLNCDIDKICVCKADSDTSPYDSGSYASSTTYVTGKAVEKACRKLIDKIKEFSSDILNVPPSKLEFTGSRVCTPSGESITLEYIAIRATCFCNNALHAVCSHSSPVSPPPFMVGMAEIELDKETGSVKVCDYTAVVDCGTPVNVNLARIQAEGGIVQGIGMALYENVTYSETGHIAENSFMQYKIPTRMDIGSLNIEFESSYEESGPYGAKSIGEIVINTPSPAIAHAIHNATGVWHRELPITPEKILMSTDNID